MSKDKWQEKIQNIEEGFIPYLPKEEGYEKTVLEAVNYSINAGGKRLRPDRKSTRLSSSHSH